MYLLRDVCVWLSSGEPGNFIYTAQKKESLYPKKEKPLEQEQKSETVRKRGMEKDAERYNKTDSNVRLARLVSLPVTALDDDLCVSFWYRFTGKHTGALHIWQKKEGRQEGEKDLQREGKERQRDIRNIDQDVLLWKMEWQETTGWKEGRILMPHADKPYKVQLFNPHSLTSHCVDLIIFLLLYFCMYMLGDY